MAVVRSLVTQNRSATSGTFTRVRRERSMAGHGTAAPGAGQVDAEEGNISPEAATAASPSAAEGLDQLVVGGVDIVERGLEVRILGSGRVRRGIGRVGQRGHHGRC